MKAIVNGKILLPQGELQDQALIFDQTILDICQQPPAGCEVIDAGGLYVSPGFVDVHIHGYRGADASDGDVEGLRRMARGILANGVTSFLPTTMTVSWEELKAAFAAIRAFMPESAAPEFDGAQALGCHAEGPFINPNKKGAQAEGAILPPDAQKLLAHSDIIRLVTLAPEMPGALECIGAVRGSMRVSIGHTDASYEQAMAGLAAGADHFTHTFNAMTGLVHRSPGVVGAALASGGYAELIADTFHVHPAAFTVMRRCKGDHLLLITDCTRAGGLADGQYTLGGQPIFVKGIECRLADGTIAGSVLRMNDAVRNYRDHTGAPMHEAVACASLYPARSIGAEASKGSLDPGKDADILLLDGDCRVRRVWRKGREAAL
ncbi:MAG: N-acetylglucosamine-6-phosphate deacetylase [Clostridia bacterium]|nr:N-acetylglucosamine-6-phosphate deacetylase [Clostridia bacterium]